MPEQKHGEPKRHEPSRIKKLARNVLLATAAITNVGNATSTPIEAHQTAPINRDIAGGEGNDTPVEMLLSDFSGFSLDSQVTVVDALKDKHLNLIIDRDDLRLHVVLSDSALEHKLLHLNVTYPTTNAPSNKDWSGHPVEVRMTDYEYENLKKIWKDPSSQETRIPDLLVPKGNTLKFFAIPLQRGTDPKEVSNQLLYRGYELPPQTNQ